MKRWQGFLRRYPMEVSYSTVFFPPLSWVVYQDMKTDTPWYIVLASFVLGWIMCLIFLRKVLIPVLNFLSRQVDRLFR